MPVNIYSTEKRAFVTIPRKFNYIIAEILVKKNVWGRNFWEKMDSRFRGNDIGEGGNDKNRKYEIASPAFAGAGLLRSLQCQGGADGKIFVEIINNKCIIIIVN